MKYKVKIDVIVDVKDSELALPICDYVGIIKNPPIREYADLRTEAIAYSISALIQDMLSTNKDKICINNKVIQITEVKK